MPTAYPILCLVCGEATSHLIRSEDPLDPKGFLAGIKLEIWKCTNCGDLQLKRSARANE